MGVPTIVAETLGSLNRALGQQVMLVGGWAVHCRLVLADRRTRPTEDVDVVLGRELRPARAALKAINAVQDDPRHVARLSGLPLLVDLLADDVEEALRLEPGVLYDEDGLALMVPPFADLLAPRAEHVDLISGESTVDVLLPSAGALFACKVGNLYLEFRQPAKWASDGLDALALLEAYGPAHISEDLSSAPMERRSFLADRLENVGFGGLAAQSRVAGGDPYPEGAIAVPALVLLLRTEPAVAGAGATVAVDAGAAPVPGATQPRRFHGTVKLDATRVGRDASRIADEVIAHLAGLIGANVEVTLEIEAEIPSGTPDHVVRTVTENSQTLKFTSQGFEAE